MLLLEAEGAGVDIAGDGEGSKVLTGGLLVLLTGGVLELLTGGCVLLTGGSELLTGGSKRRTGGVLDLSTLLLFAGGVLVLLFEGVNTLLTPLLIPDLSLRTEAGLLLSNVLTGAIGAGRKMPLFVLLIPLGSVDGLGAYDPKLYCLAPLLLLIVLPDTG